MPCRDHRRHRWQFGFCCISLIAPSPWRSWRAYSFGSLLQGMYLMNVYSVVKVHRAVDFPLEKNSSSGRQRECRFFRVFLKNFSKIFSRLPPTKKIHPIQSRIRWIKLCLLFSKTQIKSPYITFCGDIRADFQLSKICTFYRAYF